MRSYTLLALAALAFFGWSFLQAQEAGEVLKKEFEKKKSNGAKTKLLFLPNRSYCYR